MARRPIKPTNENLCKFASPILARWLIEAALKGSVITYGEAMLRLEKEVGFSNIGRATRVGFAAGDVMYRIHEVDNNAPLLNVLLVLQKDKQASDGAGWFMAKRHKVEQLLNKGIREENPELWRKHFERAAAAVYSYPDWKRLYEETFRSEFKQDTSKLSPTAPTGGRERDGIRRGRGGEGPNHKALRLWVKENPEILFGGAAVLRSETEVDIPSGDRVDVVYYSKNCTYSLEVKSKDSNEADLARGIYQCIKYRAVLQAMNALDRPNILAVLVTETDLPGYLKDLAKMLEVKHKKVLISDNKETGRIAYDER
jgi:hypothetical protein